MSSPSSSGNDSGGVDSQVSNSSSKGSQSNDKKQKAIQLRGKREQEAIELRGSSEERRSPSTPRRSPRRQVLQLPPPDTVAEDDGFEKLIQYCQRNRDAAVITWDNCVLQGKSFESLQDKEWLCDEIISGYYMLLQEKGLKKKYFFHTMFAAQLVENGQYTYENAQKYFGTKRRSHKPNIFMYDHLFFPINKGNSHWILINYDREEELINVYDPWPRGKSPVWVDRITQYLSDEYKRLYNNNDYAVAFKDKLRGSAVYPSCPKQTNGWDCGVYVCLFGYYLAMEKEMDFSPEYVTKYRRTIAKCLMTKKLSV
jgi:Ulp1 family protease